MSDRPTLHGHAWWAPTLGRMSRRARIATAALAAALLGVTYLVWVSPAVERATAAEAPTAREVKLAQENEALQDRLYASEGKTKAMQDGQTKAQAERKAQRAVEDAAAAQAAEERAAAARSAAAAPKPSDKKPSSGAKKPSSSTKGPGTTKPASGGDGAANSKNPTQPAGAGAVVGTVPTAPSKAELLDPASRYFGMYTSQAPFNFASLDDTSTKVGRAPNLVGYFSGWDKPFRADAVTSSWERGMLPMLTWESHSSTAANDQVEAPEYNLPTILAGAHDDYLRQYARDINTLGLPMAIRLDHEMNGNWYPWGEGVNGNNKGDYAKAWQHVHDIFEQEGANDQVIWTWAPNIINNLPAKSQGVETMAGFYPGDEYVDWVGLSGYYRPPYKPENDTTFEYTFDRSLDQLREISNKPIILAEVGASEIGDKKPEWVRSFFQGFARPENSDIVGFSWFNLAVTTSSKGALITNDWRIDSRRNSLDEFLAGIADPANRFGGEVLPGAPVPAVDAPAEPDPTPAPAPSPTPAPAPSPSPSPEPTPSPTVSPTPAPTSTTKP